MDSDGNAYCWGNGNSGKLGNGSTSDQSTPVPVTLPQIVSFSQLGVGGLFTCALSGDDQAYCWGWNLYGQLGNGNKNSQRTPVPVTMPPGVRFSQLEAGGAHTCAAGDDSQRYCWGWNYYGQLGNGNASDQSTPVPIAIPSGVGFSQLDAGGTHTCALDENGQAYCWGLGLDGQLGNGSTSQQNTPVVVIEPQ